MRAPNEDSAAETVVATQSKTRRRNTGGLRVVSDKTPDRAAPALMSAMAEAANPARVTLRGRLPGGALAQAAATNTALTATARRNIPSSTRRGTF
jgi:hypothetical protein